MSDFYVQGPPLASQASDLTGLGRVLSANSEEVGRVIRALTIKGSYEAVVKNKLQRLREQLSEEGTHLRNYGDTLSEIAALYEKTENRIRNSAEDVQRQNDPAPGSSEDRMTPEQVRQQFRLLLDELERELSRKTPEYRQLMEEFKALFLATLFTGGGAAASGENTTVNVPQGFPTKEEHYSRNQNMNPDRLPPDPETAAKWGWNDQVASDCHQFTSDDKSNVKFVSPDGRYEVIYDSEGNIVTASEDYGTYNYANPNDDYAGHFVKDVLPWIIWGNSPDDSTNPLQRGWALIVDGGINKAKKLFGKD